MSITKEEKANIIKLHEIDGLTGNAIGKLLKIHHQTALRVIRQQQSPHAELPLKPNKPTVIDDYIEFIQQKIKSSPHITCKRLLEILRKKGYPGSISTLRRAVNKLRPEKPANVFIPRKVFAGEEAQVDWAEKVINFAHGTQRVYFFVMVLSWSRDIFVRASFDMKGDTFLRNHVHAFKHFSGIPELILYDNLKSVVISNDSQGVRFSDRFLSFSSEYLFKTKA